MTFAGDREPLESPSEDPAAPSLAGQDGAIEARLVRQGRRNLRILWAMTLSLALAVVGLLCAWAFQIGAGQANHANQVAAADAVRANPPTGPGRSRAPHPRLLND